MRYLASLYSDKFKHPIVAAVLTIAVMFYVLAAAVQATAPFVIPVWGREVPPIAAGFLGVFGTLALAIWVVAFGTLLVARLVSELRDRTAPTSA